MIFGAFANAKTAHEALEHAKENGFKSAGFAAIALRRDRPTLTEQTPPGDLAELLTELTWSPSMSVGNEPVGSSGALAGLLESDSDVEGGLAARLETFGLVAEAARAFEVAIENSGIIVGIAAENPDRATLAKDIIERAGSAPTAVLRIPGADERS